MGTSYRQFVNPPPPWWPPTHRTCARWACGKTDKITFEKPLCYPHWLEWEALELEECNRCHWVYAYDEAIVWATGGYAGEFDFLCDECLWHAVEEKRRPEPWSSNAGRPEEKPIFAHAKLESTTHHVYVLKLSDGTFYIGQTSDLVIRLQEHRDGTQPQTAGKNPKLVYFEEFVGQRNEVRKRENELTVWNQSSEGRRWLREMIEEFRAPLRLLDLNV